MFLSECDASKVALAAGSIASIVPFAFDILTPCALCGNMVCCHLLTNQLRALTAIGLDL